MFLLDVAKGHANSIPTSKNENGGFRLLCFAHVSWIGCYLLTNQATGNKQSGVKFVTGPKNREPTFSTVFQIPGCAPVTLECKDGRLKGTNDGVVLAVRESLLCGDFIHNNRELQFYSQVPLRGSNTFRSCGKTSEKGT